MQATMSEPILRPVCDACPKCAASECAPTLQTPSSAHCRCSVCGHVWREETPYAKEPRHARRRTWRLSLARRHSTNRPRAYKGKLVSPHILPGFRRKAKPDVRAWIAKLWPFDRPLSAATLRLSSHEPDMALASLRSNVLSEPPAPRSWDRLVDR
jgi:hypothetical protein